MDNYDEDNYDEREENVRRLLMAEFAGYPPPKMLPEALPRLRLLDLAFSNRLYPELNVYVGTECDFAYYRHIEFDDWYLLLYIFTPEEIPYVISHLMVSLLNEYPGEVKALVRFLDVPTSLSPYVLQAMTQNGWPSTISSEISESKEPQFSALTVGQIHAILEWLKLSREWPDVEYSHTVVDSAINYWEQRLARTSKPEVEIGK